MAEKSLTFNLFGKDVSASRAVSEFGEKTKSSVAGMLADLGRLAIGFIGITGVVDFGKKAVDAALAAQTANEKLDVALKNAHSSLTANSSAITDQQAKMESYGFTGAQTADAIRVLTTGFGDSTRALSGMQVTADLATYKNISLSDSALIVAKAMEGQLKPLKQLGIDLPVYSGTAQNVALANSQLAKAQQAVSDLLAKYPDALDSASKHHAAYEAAVKKVADAQQLVNDKASAGQQIIDALSQKLSGEAAKSGETFAGKLATLNAQWDALQVKVGNAVLPVLSKFVDFLNTKLLPDLDNLGKSKGPEKMAKDIATALGWNGSDSAGPLSGNAWAHGWDQLMGKFSTGWDQLMEKFGNGAKQFADGPFNWKNWEHGWDQITARFALGWDQIVTETQKGGIDVNVIAAQAWGNLGTALGHGWAQITARFAEGWNQIEQGFSRGWGQIIQGFSRGWDQLMTMFGHGWDQITSRFAQGWQQIQQGFSNGWNQIIQAFANGGNQIISFVSGMWANILGAFANGWAQIQGFLTGHPLSASGSVNVTQHVSTLTSTAAGLAAGGVVRARPGGTPTIIGEGGSDEAVIPLTPDVLSKIGAGIGGTGSVNNIQIFEVHDPVGTANAVMRRLDARGAV